MAEYLKAEADALKALEDSLAEFRASTRHFLRS